jgi:hypothetical protein
MEFSFRSFYYVYRNEGKVSVKPRIVREKIVDIYEIPTAAMLYIKKLKWVYIYIYLYIYMVNMCQLGVNWF